MKKSLSIFIMIILSVLILNKSVVYAKVDILREVDALVDASVPNVLLLAATDKFMTRPSNDDGTGAVNENKGDDPAVDSRLYLVKDVLVGFTEIGVLDATKGFINYGFMANEQEGYYPYFHFHGPGDGKGDYFTSGGYPGGFQGIGQSYDPGDGHGPLPYYFKYFSDLGTYPPLNATYPINPGDEGTLLVKIDTANSLTQNGPAGAADSDPDEVEVIKKFLALQKDGGLALDNAAASDGRIDDVFKKTADGNNFNDAYDYFSNVVIPGDAGSNSGCFSKNFIIYLADGFGAGSAFAAAATNANSLYDLTVGGNSTPVKTFVIGVLDFDPAAASNFGNMRENLNEIARKGGTDASESVAYGLNRTSIPTTASCKGNATGCVDYAFFVKSRSELRTAFLSIISAISAGDYVTGAPSATSSAGTFVTNNIGILGSTEFPEWRGHLRAVDLVNDYFWWDGGASLLISSAADPKLPKAISGIPAVANLSASWRDTDGDGTVDQPPLTVTIGAKTYQYTNRVLYCKSADYPGSCKSSSLASYRYAGSPATFKISNVSTSYTYLGAFYNPPWEDRKVYTSDLSTGNLISLTDSLADDSKLSTINSLGGWFGSLSDTADKDYAKAIVNFSLGGVDEDKNGTVDYARQWLLGDMTNVVPIGVGKPINPQDNLTGRNFFREDFGSRGTVVYTGSNDQMLHAFDFETGNEVFAYIPPDLLGNLKTLFDNAVASSDPAAFMGQPANPSSHIYGVAASPRVNDVQFADGIWHTILGVGEGPGGRSFFAFDITHPKGSSDYSGASWATEKRYDNNIAPFDLLWHTSQTAPVNLTASSLTLGETWSVPAFGRIKDGGTYKWVAYVGSGYDDTDYSDMQGEVFHIVNVEDGTLVKSFNIDASSPAVQYGLFPDSVSIIKQTGSSVKTSYQVDLEGRLSIIDTGDSNIANWTKTQLVKAGVLNASNTSKPFYYSPAVWDFDNQTTGALNLMVLGSGAFDDPESDALESTIYFSIINPASPLITDAIAVNISAVSGTKVDNEGNNVGSVAAGGLTNAKVIASPVIFNNFTSGNLEALVLVFDPPAAKNLGCEFGNSYLLVFNMGSPGTFSGAGASSAFDLSAGSAMKSVQDGKADFIVSMGTGKVSGIGVAGGGSHVVAGQSGHGAGSVSGFNTAGGGVWNPIGETIKLFWKEITN